MEALEVYSSWIEVETRNPDDLGEIGQIEQFTAVGSVVSEHSPEPTAHAEQP